MSANFRQPPNAGAEAVIVSKNITANGTYNASSDSADGYNPVTVNVPGPTIVSKNITANGTYNASSDSADGYNPVTVNIHIPATLTGSSDPTNSQGVNGDTYIKIDDETSLKLDVEALGGYNGGANVICRCNDIEIIHAIGNAPFNLDYNVKSGSISIYGKTVRVEITPPTVSTSNLTITWYIDDVSVWVNDIPSNGANSSYGYNSILTHNENIVMDDNYILGMWYKQSGAWLMTNDIIDI